MVSSSRNQTFTLDEVVEAVLNDNENDLSDLELGDLSEEEEELINDGFDPELDSG